MIRVKMFFFYSTFKNTNRFAIDQLLTKRQRFIINNYQQASMGVNGLNTSAFNIHSAQSLNSRDK